MKLVCIFVIETSFPIVLYPPRAVANGCLSTDIFLRITRHLNATTCFLLYYVFSLPRMSSLYSFVVAQLLTFLFFDNYFSSDVKKEFFLNHLATMHSGENPTSPTSTSNSKTETNIKPRRTSLSQTRFHVNSVSVPTQNTTKSKGSRIDGIISDDFSSSNNMPSAATLGVSFAKHEKKHLTAYEKLLYDSQHDMRFKAEEKAGRRIGFYRIRGDIGLGNFSRVKLGIHLLAKGNESINNLYVVKGISDLDFFD